MKSQPPSLLPILRSDVQGRILARLFTDPESAFNLTELASWAGSSMPTVQREVGRAEAAGIVTTWRVGPARLVRADTAHPLYEPLAQVIVATYGPPAVIAREFAGLTGTEMVLIFGSWAARYLGQAGRAPNDIDVLVIGSPARDAVDDAAERVERAIGVPVQATIRSRTHWSQARDSFVQEVQRRPMLVVLEGDDVVSGTPHENKNGTGSA